MRIKINKSYNKNNLQIIKKNKMIKLKILNNKKKTSKILNNQ